MKIDAQLQPEDLLRAHRVHRRLSPAARLVFIVIPISWCAITLWKLWEMGQKGMFSYGIAAAAGLTLIGFIASRVTRRKLLERHDPITSREIAIGPDGIVIVTPMGKETLFWLRFVKYKCGKDVVLLYRSNTDYLIFPDRWFTAEQREKFGGYLRSELGEPAK